MTAAAVKKKVPKKRVDTRPWERFLRWAGQQKVAQKITQKVVQKKVVQKKVVKARRRPVAVDSQHMSHTR